MKRRNQFVFVLGPHRSGTSLVAGSLHALGVSLGREFIAPNQDNPKGFFEEEEIVRFNDRLLRSMSLSWDSFGFIWEQDFTVGRLPLYHKAAVALVRTRFKDAAFAGLKDPRLCILLPFWKSVIAEALDVDISYVLCVRKPEHCVASQKARHIKDSDFHLVGRRNVHTLLLWLTYTLKALAHVDPKRLLVVNYGALIEAPEMQLQRLARFLDIDTSPEKLANICRERVDPQLNRNNQQGAVSRNRHPRVWAFAASLYERLSALSLRDAVNREAIAEILEEWDMSSLETLCLQEVQYIYGYSYRKINSLRHRLIQCVDELVDERGKVAQLSEQLRVLNEAHEKLNADHQAVLNTKGWKLLTVLRRLVQWAYS